MLPLEFFKTFAAKGGELLQKSKDGFKRSLDALYKMLNVFSKGEKAITEFFESIWKKIANWFLENKKRFKNKSLSISKVIYGESKLSKIAINYRKTLGNAKFHNGNVVVFQYLDTFGNIQTKAFTTLKGVRKHAEILGIEWIRRNNIPNKNVIKIYSELEPCSLKVSNCKKELEIFKNAKIEYSYDYPGNESFGARIRQMSVKKRKKDLKNKL